ncbi:MAG: hypothetical protein MR601_04785 [Erysipelotrichaceae bacterium]|nr:hypothetical protein [Erysipelotrichaceae bacterium]
MKKILGLFVFCLLASCSNKVNLSKNVDSDTLWEKDKFNNETFKNEIILKDEYSISFWYKSNSNKTNTVVLNMGDSDNYIKLTSSGYNVENNSYSGLTLFDDEGNWVVAKKEDTLKSNRFNYVVINVNGNNASVYLNGVLVSKGKIKNNINLNEFIIGENSNGFYSGLILKDKVLEDKTILEEYNKKLPSVLLDTINISESDDLIHDYWIDNYKIEGHLVEWTSSNKDVIDYRGVIMKEVDEDTAVILNATLNINGFSATKDFIVNVRKNDENRRLIRDSKKIYNYVDKVIHDGHILIDELENGSDVYWEIEGNAVIENNTIKKVGLNEKENIKLHVKLVNGEHSFKESFDVILMDKIEGYIMSYFNGELEEETGYLAYSYDGVNWEKLNTKITSQLGSRRIRDPFISRDKNGDFMIVATEGFDNPNIYVFKDTGLLDFNQQNLIQVAYYDAGLKMTGERAWAPEFYYDLKTDKYYMYFSDNGFINENGEKGGPIFASTTADFSEFDYPYIYFNPGYSVIDGTIIRVNGSNYMFYKDERKAAQTIFYAEGETLEGFNKAYDEQFLNVVKYMEGPFVFKDKNGGYFIYMDNYPNGKFYAGHFNNLKEKHDILWFEENQIKLPENDVRHGSVVGVTKNELEKIIEKYK